MTSRASAEDDRRIRCGIRERAVELDDLADIPAWTLDTTGPEPVLRDPDGEPMATIHGPWTPNLARYLTAIGGDAGPAIVDLLRCVAGGRSQDIRDAAEKLLAELGIEEVDRG